MGTQQYTGDQISEDHRLAEAPENRHQQDGGKQQDQHICVQIFPPFLST